MSLPKNPRLLLVGLLLAYPFLKHGFFDPWVNGYEGGDFTIYYVAAERLAAGKSPYPLQELAQADQLETSPIWGEYPYPPLLARLLVPLTRFPIFTAKYIYILVCLFLFVWQMALLFRRKDWEPAEQWGALAVLLGWGPFLYTLRLGQCELLAIPLLAAAWRWILVSESRDSAEACRWETAAGLCLGVAAMVRVTPVLMLPVLLVTCRWRLAVSFVVGSLATLILSGPWSSWEFFTRVLPTMSDVGGMRHCPAFHVLVLTLLDAIAPAGWAPHFQRLATLLTAAVYACILALLFGSRKKLTTEAIFLLGCYLPPLFAGKNPHHYTLALFPVIGGMTLFAREIAARWAESEQAGEGSATPETRPDQTGSAFLFLWPLALIPCFQYWFPLKALFDKLVQIGPLNGNALFIVGNLVAFGLFFHRLRLAGLTEK